MKWILADKCGTDKYYYFMGQDERLTKLIGKACPSFGPRDKAVVFTSKEEAKRIARAFKIEKIEKYSAIAKR